MTADAARDSTLVDRHRRRTATPQRAADLANAIAAQLIAASDTVYGKSGQVQDFVAGQISAAQVQIADTQAEIDRLTGLPVPHRRARTSSWRRSRAGWPPSASPTPRSWDSPGRPPNAITVVDPATPPEAPSSPRVLLNTLLAAIVGLLIALGIAFTLEYLDDTVKSSDGRGGGRPACPPSARSSR